MSEVRQRASNKKPDTATTPTPAARAKAEDSSISLIDICRGVVFLVLASSVLSYFVTGDSLVWNIQRPAITRPEVIKAYFVRATLIYVPNMQLTSIHASL